MLPLVEFRVLDHNAVAIGISLARLMERAGEAVARGIVERWSTPGQALVFCGPGNNGGDGLVVARLLVGLGWGVTVVLVASAGSGELRTELARSVYERLPREVSRLFWGQGPPPREVEDGLQRATIAVDALLGSGLAGRLREPFATAVNLLNDSCKPVVSVDVPTGLGAEPIVRPVLTVTFAEAKEGMDPDNSGEIVEADIGFPHEAHDRCGPGEAQLWPRPDPGARKGDHGRVVIIGGGPYAGAPILAGLGAFRSGADLVYLLVPENVAEAAKAHMPEFIVQPLEGDHLAHHHMDIIGTYDEMADAVVLGPGLGRAPETREAVLELIQRLKSPLVVDADALFALGGDLGTLDSRARAHARPSDLTILTPHRGELERIGGQRTATGLKAFANEVRATVLAKGPVDLITDGEYLKENHSGNPRMAAGGTGDVLAGCVGALKARGLSGYQAARLGAYLVGSAGDLALEELGWGYLASEVAHRIPGALRLALSV